MPKEKEEEGGRQATASLRATNGKVQNPLTVLAPYLTANTRERRGKSAAEKPGQKVGFPTATAPGRRNRGDGEPAKCCQATPYGVACRNGWI